MQIVIMSLGALQISLLVELSDNEGCKRCFLFISILKHKRKLNDLDIQTFLPLNLVLGRRTGNRCF